jgi:eukaryotic-like serine/threonine-protein kinase
VKPASKSAPSGKLGRYELIGRLATGGMGEIFLASLEGAAGFEKLYVVKKILPHLAQDPRFRGMLIDEARIASRMSHPNICQVYELEETDGQLYIVMEYLEGVTVLPLLRRASKSQTPLPLGLVTGVISQTCEALHYAHELQDRDGSPLNIVHRDVTPSNVFVTESGVAKVLDFGIAKVKNASAQTQTGTVKGKYAYMAPEQLKGGELDRRVDVFAIGVVLFEMLSLRRLFQRKTDYLTFRAVMEQSIPDVRRYRQDVNENLTAVVMKALDRDANNRFKNVRELGAAILDSSGSRAWSNSEIGDFLKSNFAEVIRKRSAALLSATTKDPQRESGPIGRSTMPILADMGTGADQESDTDDDEFPSVESDFHEFAGAPARSPSVNDFAVVTPPPFSNESTKTNIPFNSGLDQFGRATSPSLPGFQQTQAVQALPFANAPSVAVVPKRSLLLPIVVAVGVAVIAIAAVIVYKLWHRIEQIDNQPMQTITPEMEVTPRTDIVAPGSNGSANGEAVPPVAKGSGSSSKLPDKTPVTNQVNNGNKKPDKVTDKPPNGSNATTVVRQAIAACDQDVDAETKAALRNLALSVSVSAVVTKVELTPGKFTFTPFGACLKSALLGKKLVEPKLKDAKEPAVLNYPIGLTK